MVVGRDPNHECVNFLKNYIDINDIWLGVMNIVSSFVLPSIIVRENITRLSQKM